MSKPWYCEYFDEVYLAAHGLGLERAPGEADLIVRALALPPGSAILDLACGCGRHAIELARRGYRVTGLDLSRTLLSQAGHLAGNASVKVELVEEDMRRVPETWAARFDGVINVLTSWGYFEADADNERVIEGVARSLKLGGRFFLDVLNRDWLVRNFREHGWREGQGGVIVAERNRLDLLTGRSEVENTILFPDGHRLVRPVSIRLYTLAEVASLFRKHHLAVRETYGGWQGEAYGLDSRRMIVVAERER
jgi:SAM-dependent methyltransferase